MIANLSFNSGCKQRWLGRCPFCGVLDGEVDVKFDSKTIEATCRNCYQTKEFILVDN